MSIPTVFDAHEAAIADLGRPGDWLTADQRVDVWRQVRDAATHPLDRARAAAVTPHAVEGSHEATDHLPAAAVEVAHRIASDPGRLTRTWADEQIAALGEETYTEVVGVTSTPSTSIFLGQAADVSFMAVSRLGSLGACCWGQGIFRDPRRFV